MITIPEEIINASVKGQLVLFVGSGLSKSLGFLDWRSLAINAIEDFNNSYPKVNILKECLKQDVLNEILILDALRYINETKIYEFIRRNYLLEIDSDKLEVQKKLWKISERIITTNYDETLGLTRPDSRIEIICHDHRYEISKQIRENKWLYHIHGTINNVEKCVIFSSDYHKLYNEQNACIQQLKSIFINNTVIFIGFSMKDKYLSNILTNLSMIYKLNQNNDCFIILKENEALDNKFLRRINIKEHNEIPAILDEIIKNKNLRLQSPVKVTRFLRRRCRSFESGSDLFNNIIKKLLLETINSDDYKSTLNTIDSFKSEYEKCMSKAALFENQGSIEKMIRILETYKFEGNEELSRKLYLALAYEKIDYLKAAISLLHNIISLPIENEITLSAKFNLAICYEKIEDYENVNFKEFIKIGNILNCTNELISDKAINNELIYCYKTKQEYKYKDLLMQQLERSIKHSPKSYYKSFINYLTYLNKSLDKVEYDKLLKLSKDMSVNSRVSILFDVFRKFDKETRQLLKDDFLSEIKLLASTSDSVSTDKYLKEFISLMDEK